MKELLFSIGPKDFKWDFFKTSGPGGQNKNKRDTACRCTHIASGAIGIGSEEREQGKNRRLAFERCVNSEKFKAWHKLECARVLVDKNERRKIEREVDAELSRRENLLVEIKDKDGRWTELRENDDI
jgi:protein subunit release factor B